MGNSPIDYFPRTINGNWTYEFDNNPSDTVMFFVISPILNAIGNTYSIFMVDRDISTDSSGYYRKARQDYFRYMDMGDFIGFDKPLWGEYIFLKDTAAGVNWKSAAFQGTVTIAPSPPQPLIVRFSSTILQKDVTVSLSTSSGTVNYSNVIVVEEKYDRFESGNWVNISPVVGSLKRYYARNIGLIKYEAVNGAGNITTLLELR